MPGSSAGELMMICRSGRRSLRPLAFAWTDDGLGDTRAVIVAKSDNKPRMTGRCAVKTIRRLVLAAGALAATLASINVHANAQDYPTRPIVMIVPFAAGGPVDVIARTVAEGMARFFGQP